MSAGPRDAWTAAASSPRLQASTPAFTWLAVGAACGAAAASTTPAIPAKAGARRRVISAPVGAARMKRADIRGKSGLCNDFLASGAEGAGDWGDAKSVV